MTSNEWKLYNNIENIVGSQYTPNTIDCYLNKNFFLLILKLNLNALSKNYYLIASWMLKMPFNKGNKIPNAFYYTDLYNGVLASTVNV